jgi:hypothetical protein
MIYVLFERNSMMILTSDSQRGIEDPDGDAVLCIRMAENPRFNHYNQSRYQIQEGRVTDTNLEGDWCARIRKAR